jgi:hypothetical protein
MKTFIKILFLLSITVVYPANTSANSTTIIQRATVLNKVVSLLNVNNKKQIALVRDMNQSQKSFDALKQTLESQNFEINVYEINQVMRIQEDLVLVSSLSKSNIAPKVFEKKIIISDDLNDIKADKAGISIQDINGNTRVFISNTYFQNKNINVDQRLIRASTVFTSK